MSKIANIAKNTSYLTLALIVQKIISFLYFILLARFLGLEALGQYYTAIAFTTIFSIFIDLGFANVLTREVAKDQDRASFWLQTIVAIKLVLGAITAVVALLLAFFLYKPVLFVLILFSSISMILDSFTNTFFSVARGFHNLKYESLASILFQLIVLVFGLLVIYLNWPLYALVAVLSLASLFNVVYSASIVSKYLKLKIRPIWNYLEIKKMLRLSIPFALYNIFQRLFTYLDSLLLGFLAGYSQVGIYQIAFKLIFALQFLPMAFTASLYPALSSYWKNNPTQLRITFERALNYLLILSLPIIFGVFSLADKIVPLFKAGEEAVWPLRLSILALFFIFLNFPVGSLLNACDRQKRNTLNMGIATALSIALNLIFIPLWQALGASLTVLISNAIMFFLGIFSIGSLITYRPYENLRVLFKSLFAAVIMGLLIFFSKETLPLLFSVALGAFLYFLTLYLVGGFKKADIISIIKSFR